MKNKAVENIIRIRMETLRAMKPNELIEYYSILEHEKYIEGKIAYKEHSINKNQTNDKSKQINENHLNNLTNIIMTQIRIMNVLEEKFKSAMYETSTRKISIRLKYGEEILKDYRAHLDEQKRCIVDRSKNDDKIITKFYDIVSTYHNIDESLIKKIRKNLRLEENENLLFTILKNLEYSSERQVRASKSKQILALAISLSTVVSKKIDENSPDFLRKIAVKVMANHDEEITNDLISKSFNPQNDSLKAELSREELKFNRIINFIKDGADINTKNSKGFTALHLACKEGNFIAVKRLLRLKPDISIKSSGDFSVLDFAILSKDEKIISLIIKNHKKINDRKYLIFFGPPGVGKGTQAEKLIKYLDIPQVSTGAMLREEIAAKTELGLRVKPIIDNGGIVDDETIIKIVKKRLSKKDAGNGVIFDGFPRTTNQARILTEMLQKEGKMINHLIYLEAPKEELIKRLLNRAVIEKRKDDTEIVIKNRLIEYREKTRPALEVFEPLGLVRHIDGVGSKEEVFSRIMRALENN